MTNTDTNTNTTNPIQIINFGWMHNEVRAHGMRKAGFLDIQLQGLGNRNHHIAVWYNLDADFETHEITIAERLYSQEKADRGYAAVDIIEVGEPITIAHEFRAGAEADADNKRSAMRLAYKRIEAYLNGKYGTDIKIPSIAKR